MVAKINRGVSLYGAIVYNQQKVDDATARIIYENRMITDVTGNPEQVMRQTIWAFENYLLANKNTEKPVLHISLNPSLDDRLTANLPTSPKSICRRWDMATSPTSYMYTRTSAAGTSISYPLA